MGKAGTNLTEFRQAKMLTMALKVLLCVALIAQASVIAQVVPCQFLGAVYEHAYHMPLNNDSVTIMEENLEIFRTQSEAAAARGAQVVVFPERGITGLNWDTEDDIYYQWLPDASAGEWNPCLTESPTNQTFVPYTFSCMARDNKIMVVANFPTSESCDEYAGAACPARGEFHFSTDAVFGADGTLLARYHKMNMYGESEFDVPPTIEDVVVDTPFGRLGLLTCFDLLWQQPTVALVEQYQVDTLLFPTAWQDQLPYLTSVQSQSSFAVGLDVNILAANMHFPLAGFMGSGVYAGGLGPVVYSYNANVNGTLLVAPLPCWRNATATNHKQSSQYTSQSNDDHAGIRVPRSSSLHETHNIKHEDLSEFVGVALTEPGQFEPATTQLCQGTLCCGANYTLYDESVNGTSAGSYVLVVHSGNISEGDLYTYVAEVCSVLWCETAGDLSTCARQPSVPVTVGLVDLTLWGQFHTRYVYPSVLTDDLQLLPAYRWTHVLPDVADPDTGEYYAEIRLKMPGGALPPVLTTAVTLYGRRYDEDATVAERD